MADGFLLRAWAVTLALLGLAGLGLAAVVVTGGPVAVVLSGAFGLSVVAYAAARSGGRFAFESEHARPLDAADHPTVERAARDVAERAGRPFPRLLVLEMDAPGAVVGYDDGRPVVAVDPLLPRVVGSAGVQALLAHELGHLHADRYADAVRAYLPQVVGFSTYWLVFLAHRGPPVAAAGTAVYLAAAFTERPRIRAIRWLLGLGTEPLALALSRHANRLEEYHADAYAATLVDPGTLADALYRVAAVATGDNTEDLAGPVPWNADRTLAFALFATHPSVENRVRRLGAEIPEWARPYQPHR